jgi:hypothetical protein
MIDRRRWFDRWHRNHGHAAQIVLTSKTRLSMLVFNPRCWPLVYKPNDPFWQKLARMEPVGKLRTRNALFAWRELPRITSEPPFRLQVSPSIQPRL